MNISDVPNGLNYKCLGGAELEFDLDGLSYNCSVIFFSGALPNTIWELAHHMPAGGWCRKFALLSTDDDERITLLEQLRARNHPYSGANLRIKQPSGFRVCRQCHRDQSRKT